MHEDVYYSRFLRVLILHVKRVMLVINVIVPVNNAAPVDKKNFQSKVNFNVKYVK